MSITGLPGQGPSCKVFRSPDLTSGLLLAQASAALYRARRLGGGRGTYSLLEAQIFMLDFQAARWLISVKLPSRPATTSDFCPEPAYFPQG